MSKFQVTLKQLRAAGACFSGYNKLVASISGEPLVASNRYAVFDFDQPISVLQILNSNGLQDAIWALRCTHGADREIRLFAVLCARQVQHLITDERSLAALNVAEKFANGLATKEELAYAYAAADAAYAHASAVAYAAYAAAADAANAAANSAVDAAANAANAAAYAAYAAANAAVDAAVDAVHVASINAAYSAAYSAARASCVAAQETQFRKMLNGV